MGIIASDLERQIDELYQRPLREFTTVRNGLAKALSGGAKADAARVKTLTKPTVIPWAVNQVYWRARSIWDRLMASGQAVRTHQLTALGGEAVTPGAPGKPSGARRRAGKAVEVGGADRAAEDLAGAHRRALSDALHQAVRAAADAGAQPAVDQLARMLEAVSLAASTAEPPGRFTEPVQPAGFEALLGVTIAPPSQTPGGIATPLPDARSLRTPTRATTTGARAHAHEAAAARRAEATEALASARRHEAAARETAAAAAAQAVDDAELRLTQAKAALADAQTAARTAVAAGQEAERTIAGLRET
ncbi:MAG: hypothetical protein FJW27_12060 [Acidimicrobiia bacterium]|nr:hypothetical protein [Acidimicrobiia bacterium]